MTVQWSTQSKIMSQKWKQYTICELGYSAVMFSHSHTVTSSIHQLKYILNGIIHVVYGRLEEILQYYSIVQLYFCSSALIQSVLPWGPCHGFVWNSCFASQIGSEPQKGILSGQPLLIEASLFNAVSSPHQRAGGCVGTPR